MPFNPLSWLPCSQSTTITRAAQHETYSFLLAAAIQEIRALARAEFTPHLSERAVDMHISKLEDAWALISQPGYLPNHTALHICLDQLRTACTQLERFIDPRIRPLFQRRLDTLKGDDIGFSARIEQPLSLGDRAHYPIAPPSYQPLLEARIASPQEQRQIEALYRRIIKERATALSEEERAACLEQLTTILDSTRNIPTLFYAFHIIQEPSLALSQEQYALLEGHITQELTLESRVPSNSAWEVDFNRDPEAYILHHFDQIDAHYRKEFPDPMLLSNEQERITRYILLTLRLLNLSCTSAPARMIEIGGRNINIPPRIALSPETFSRLQTTFYDMIYAWQHREYLFLEKKVAAIRAKPEQFILELFTRLRNKTPHYRETTPTFQRGIDYTRKCLGWLREAMPDCEPLVCTYEADLMGREFQEHPEMLLSRIEDEVQAICSMTESELTALSLAQLEELRATTKVRIMHPLGIARRIPGSTEVRQNRLINIDTIPSRFLQRIRRVERDKIVALSSTFELDPHYSQDNLPFFNSVTGRLEYNRAKEACGCIAGYAILRELTASSVRPYTDLRNTLSLGLSRYHDLITRIDPSIVAESASLEPTHVCAAFEGILAPHPDHIQAGIPFPIAVDIHEATAQADYMELLTQFSPSTRGEKRVGLFQKSGIFYAVSIERTRNGSLLVTIIDSHGDPEEIIHPFNRAVRISFDSLEKAALFLNFRSPYTDYVEGWQREAFNSASILPLQCLAQPNLDLLGQDRAQLELDLRAEGQIAMTAAEQRAAAQAPPTQTAAQGPPAPTAA